MKRNSGVLNESCGENVSMDLEQMGLMGTRFNGRNNRIFVVWIWLRNGIIVMEMNESESGGSERSLVAARTKRFEHEDQTGAIWCLSPSL